MESHCAGWEEIGASDGEGAREDEVIVQEYCRVGLGLLNFRREGQLLTFFELAGRLGRFWIERFWSAEKSDDVPSSFGEISLLANSF